MNETSRALRKITTAAVVGAAYAALTILIAPIAYGPIQMRITEAMCILPFFIPSTAWGLFIGCMIANLASSAGILDVVFGSLATLLSSLCVARMGRSYREAGSRLGVPACAAACFMPVLFNGPIVGAVLAATLTPTAFWAGFATFGLQVAFGEAVVMYLLGLPLMGVLPRIRLIHGLS